MLVSILVAVATANDAVAAVAGSEWVPLGHVLSAPAEREKEADVDVEICGRWCCCRERE